MHPHAARPILLAGLVLLGLALPVSAEFRLPATDGIQDQPVVAARPDGGFAVVWHEHFPGAAQPLNTIRMQLFNGEGAAIGSNFRVDILPGDNARKPDVEVAADGSFVIVWEGGASEGRNRRTVWCRRFDAKGQPRGAEIRVTPDHLTAPHSTGLNRMLGGPALSIAPDGGFVVAWRDDGQKRCNNSNIIIRRYDAKGSPLGESTRVNSDLGLEHLHPAIDHDAAGNFVVVWQRGALLGTQDARGMVFAQRFKADGKPIESNLVVGGSGRAFGPDLAVAPDGSWAVTWSDVIEEPDKRGIAARVFDPESQASPIFEVVSPAPKLRSIPTIASTEAGYVVAWSTETEDPWIGFAIRARQFAFDGSDPGPISTIGPLTCRHRSAPHVAALPGGAFVAVWNIMGSGWIEGQKTAQSGRRLPTQSLGPTIDARWRETLPLEERFPVRAERKNAAEELGCFRFEASAAASTLAEVIAEDPDHEVKAEAALSLAKVSPNARRAFPLLMNLLNDTSFTVQAGAVRGLGVLGLADAVPELAGLLRGSPSSEVRAAAASSLADIAHNPAAADDIEIDLAAALKRALDDRNRLVRTAAMSALVRLPRPPDDLPDLIFERLYEDEPSFALSLIASMGPAAKSSSHTVRKALKHPDPIVRTVAVRCLVRIGWGVPSETLTDLAPSVRSAAFNGLFLRGRGSLLGTARAIEKAARNESNPSVRRTVDMAWQALQDCQCDDAIFEQ